MPIPYGKLERKPIPFIQGDDWREVFDLIQRRSVTLAASQQVRALIAADEDLLLLALYRVVQQHWRSSVRFPCRLSAEERQAVNALGDVWLYKLRICERLHSRTDYKNAEHWFFELVMEYRSHKMNALLSSNIQKGKKKLADIIQNDLKALREGTNPENRAESPHHWLLLQTALEVVDEDQFRRQIWTPYLSAVVSWKNQIKANGALQSIYLEDGDFFVQTGQGRGKISAFQNLTAKSL